MLLAATRYAPAGRSILSGVPAITRPSGGLLASASAPLIAAAMPSPSMLSVTVAGPASAKVHKSGVRGASRPRGSRHCSDCAASNGSGCGPCPVSASGCAIASSRATTRASTLGGSTINR